ncbi:MAG: DMT family transporter [Deltaproteobacteria bacterium]|nr:DMT family transporter [Deltaproteobacteria bacterium]
MNPSKNSHIFTLLMVLSMVIWGGSWVSAKAIASSLSPESLTFWRSLVNTIALIPVLYLVKGPKKMGREALGFTLLGALFLSGYMYLFFMGLSIGYAGAAGVLVTTTVPLITFVLSAAIFRQGVSGKDALGLALGVIGGAALLGVWTLDAGRIFIGGNAYFLVAAFLWALLTLCSQKACGMISPILFSLVANAVATVIFFFLAIPNGIGGALSEGPLFWFNIFYLGVISSAFATTVYFLASNRLSSRRASSFVFLVPISAVFLSWLFLGEAPRLNTVAGGALAMGAVYIINSRH